MGKFLTEYKDIVPVVTFVMGYIVNAIIHELGSKRYIKKVKKVLLHEVTRNLDMLALGIERVGSNTSDAEYQFNKAKVVARMSESMTSNIYDVHIADISKMKDLDIDSFLSFYATLKTLQLHSSELIKYVNIDNRTEPQSNQMLARVLAVNKVADSMLKVSNKY